MEVIVLTNDRSALTTITLQSIACQQLVEHDEKRLIVFDDGKLSAMSHVPFRKMFDYCTHAGWRTEFHRNLAHKGVTYVRHLASKLVSEDIFFMIDGDVLMPESDTLARMHRYLKESTVAKFAVPRLLNIDNEHEAWYDPLAKFDGHSPEESLQWKNPVDCAQQIHVSYGATACIAYSTKAFKRVGGFSFWERISEGEEVYLSKKLGAGILLQSKAVYHFGNMWTKESLMNRLADTKYKLVNEVLGK